MRELAIFTVFIFITSCTAFNAPRNLISNDIGLTPVKPVDIKPTNNTPKPMTNTNPLFTESDIDLDNIDLSDYSNTGVKLTDVKQKVVKHNRNKVKSNISAPYIDANDISIVSGALSHHVNTDRKLDGENPLLGISSGNVECGVYDNSRIRPSNSYYCRTMWYKKKVLMDDLYITSKGGIAYYDSKSNYKGTVKVIGSVGARKHVTKDTYIDVDYAPGNLFGNTGVVSLTIGTILDLYK